MGLRRNIRRRERIISIYKQDLVFIRSLTLYRTFCRIPYEGHPKGCAMWQGKKDCDNSIRKNHTWDEFFTTEGPTWAIWETFMIDEWEAQQQKKFPNWTKKQCRNPRHWQGHIKAIRKKRVEAFFREKKLWGKYAGVTEGFCLNFYLTMRNAGVPLDPMNDLHQIRKICVLAKYKEGGMGEQLQKKVGRQLIIY